GTARTPPLLRLARQDLERLQAGLAERDRAQVELGAEPGPGGRLAHRARDPGPPQALQPFGQGGFAELERGLDQELLGERVADLHARASFLGPALEGVGR